MDAVVHGRVAAAGLARALETGGEEHDLFLQAISAGRLQRLELDLTDNGGDTACGQHEAAGRGSCLRDTSRALHR